MPEEPEVTEKLSGIEPPGIELSGIEPPRIEQWLALFAESIEAALARRELATLAEWVVEMLVKAPGGTSCPLHPDAPESSCPFCWIVLNQKEWNTAVWKILKGFPGAMREVKETLSRDADRRKSWKGLIGEYTEEEAKAYVQEYGALASREHARSLVQNFLTKWPNPEWVETR